MTPYKYGDPYPAKDGEMCCGCMGIVPRNFPIGTPFRRQLPPKPDYPTCPGCVKKGLRANEMEEQMKTRKLK